MRKLFIITAVLFSFMLRAQVAERPSPLKLYNNLSKEFPGFLNVQEAAQLEEKLEVFSNETSNQICVVIVDDLGGTDASSYATQLGSEWGVGKKGANNGVVILIKPTEKDGGRDLFIAVGYGLEGAIPDLATKRIRDEQMVPNLKAGNNFAALDQGTDVLMKLAKGEISVKDYTRSKHGRRNGLNTGAIIVIIILIILFSIFRGGGGRGRGYTYGSGGRNIFWGGGFGGGGGSWGGGSSSGGGWGGFGGGSFGGGGSGGKW